MHRRNSSGASHDCRGPTAGRLAADLRDAWAELPEAQEAQLTTRLMHGWDPRVESDQLTSIDFLYESHPLSSASNYEGGEVIV